MSPGERAVARFAATPARLSDSAAAIDSISRPVGTAEDAWSATDIVRHLIAVERDVWWGRFGSLREPGEPRWAWTEPGLEPGLDDARLDELVARFAEARLATLSIIEGFDDEAWGRTGVHETFGRLDATALLGIASDHDDEHLASLSGDPPA
jgi:hypothetical protein